MKPKINVLTLGVRDLEKAVRFYRDGLGFPMQGLLGSDAEESTVAFFNFNDGMILALYPRAWLAKDAKVPLPPAGSGGFSIGQLVSSKREVDAVMKQAEQAGATIVCPPHDRVWGGYTGYFQDPDGHLWEVVWNPDMPG